MIYKNDAEKAKKRWTAWWNGELTDRCCVNITSWKGKPYTEEQIRHLDTLLSIPKLHTIQWTQVVGQPPCTEFFPELKKIQKAGKNLLINVEPGQVEPLLQNLSSKGLCLNLYVGSPEEGEAILKQVKKLTHE